MRARSLATLRLLAAAAAAPASHDLLADAGIDLLPPAALQPRPASSGDRILGLTSTFCRPSPTNARLAETLRLACARYPTLRVALNVFDADGADACFDADNATAALPPCVVGRHRVRGHKAVFWREVATPARVSAYDIVFAFDNDMRIADDDFDLLEAARLLRRSGAGMGQPRVALTERAAVAAGSHGTRWRARSSPSGMRAQPQPPPPPPPRRRCSRRTAPASTPSATCRGRSSTR